MNLIIDQGNTRTKIALFIDGTIENIDVVLNADAPILLNNYKNGIYDHILYASTSRYALIDYLKEFEAESLMEMSMNLNFPVTIKYKSETLGHDRIANSCGAAHLFPNQDVLAIDMGTCITYDFTTKSGEFIGGGISPGLTMRLQAMNHFTAALPLVDLNTDISLVGTSTEESLQSGAFQGFKAEIFGIIEQYRTQYSVDQVVLTGGNINDFELASKSSIFASANLTLIGLHEILLHNI